MSYHKKEEYKHIPGNNPVDYFNLFYDPEELVTGKKSLALDEKGNITCCDEPFLIKKDDKYIRVPSDNSEGDIPIKSIVSPFQILCEIRFSGDYMQAIQYVNHKYMNKDVPYIRVGTHYYKQIDKINNWGVKVSNLVPWTKEAIIDDYGRAALKKINKYNDFTIEPNNSDYSAVHCGMWNLYEPFPHKPHPEPVSIEEIPTTANFMAHVFGEQIELGYKYLKVLYENPKQILPVLVLVSKERATGKSSFLNWMDIIFANNYTQISPEDMHSAFNSQYAYRNIIGIDEAVIDRQSAIEKIKSIATARTIQVNQKMVAQYRIPFYGKIIITTNRETDFMRVDNEEIRFWVRRLDTIPEDRMTADFYDNLLSEVPKLLRYLNDMEDIEYGKSRMVFTADDIANDILERVKLDSRVGLHKELDILITEWFNENEHANELYLRLKDIKNAWFQSDNRISRNYLQKVIEQEMGYSQEKNSRYQYFGSGDKIKGTPYLFRRKDFLGEEPEIKGGFGNEQKAPF